jgi:hypothetical protein
MTMMTRENRWVVWSSTVALFVLLVSSTTAEARAESAEELFSKGARRYGLADFEGSLRVLNRARKGTAAPELLARIYLYRGANHLELGRGDRAKQALAAALRLDPLLKPPEELKGSLRSLLSQQRRSLRGELWVIASRKDAKVEVDGRRAGRVPFHARLPIGAHDVAVRLPDGRVYTGEVVLFADRKTAVDADVDLWLMPQTPSPAKPAGVRGSVARQAAASTAPPAPAQPASRTREEEREPEPWTISGRWKWIAAGGALAVGSLGAWLWASSDQDYSSWEKRLARWDRQPGAEAAALDELERSIRAKEIGAWVSFGVAGGLAVTSVVLLILEQRGGSGERRVELAPMLGRTTGAVLTASF